MAHPGRPRKCDPRVETLWINISNGEFDLVKQTLQDVGIDATDGQARTALINSVCENKTDFIHWLVDHGADINHQDRIGYSVLHFIAQNKLIDLAKYFLEKGADPNLQDIHGNTPLWTAVFNSRQTKEIVRLFLKANANPDIQNKYSRTPRILYQTMYDEDISLLVK